MPGRYDNDYDVFYIPPNFIEGGTVFGGMLKLRNAIEAVILGLAVGLPVLRLPLSLTAKIITLCLTVLPLMLAAIIGIGEESLSAFAVNFVRFLRKRRVVGAEEPPKAKRKVLARLKRDDGAYSSDDTWDDFDRAQAAGKVPDPQADEFGDDLSQTMDSDEEFGEVKPKKKRRKPKREKRRQPPQAEEPEEFGEEFEDLMSNSSPPERGGLTGEPLEERQPKREFPLKLPFPLKKPKIEESPFPKKGRALVADYLPVERIVEGVVCTRDHRYVKILELNPVNFTLRNEDEKRNIIYACVAFLFLPGGSTLLRPGLVRIGRAWDLPGCLCGVPVWRAAH